MSIPRGRRRRWRGRLSHEISRVVRGRAANPKWIAGVMRHGYKGAFEIAATVDYLFGFAAITDAVSNHHFDQLFAAYLEDERVRDFMADGQSGGACAKPPRGLPKRSGAGCGRRAPTAPPI